jgi:hypothetical protein
MTATNQWLLIFESHDDLNRCTPCRGKLDQHAICPPCLICIWCWTIHLTCSANDNLSLVPTKSKEAPTPRRSIDSQRQTGPAVILGGLILPPMRPPWSRGERFQPSGYTTTSAYWVHKHQHAIGIFNTCSRGSTHQSLIDTGRGYSFEGVGLLHTIPCPSQPTISTFYLRALPDLKFKQVLPYKPKFWV